jgi:phospholipid N-methyltransferase
MSFISEFFKNKSEIGAVAPSSKFLGKKMYGGIDFSEVKCIVEFGPGTGVFTKEILKRMNSDACMIIFETNPNFFQKLTEDIKDDRVLILNESAEKIGEYLALENQEKADYIISSLPLTVFPKELKENILKGAAENLSKKGQYIQFQYSLNAHKLLKETFGSVKLAFSLINVPPAFVYKCSL